MEVLPRQLFAGLAVGAASLLLMPGPSLGDLSHDLSIHRQSASELRAAIAAETKRIQATDAGLRAARAQVAVLQARVDQRQAQLAAVQRDVVATRENLTRLENKLHDAAAALSAQLVASYKEEPPDVVTVVLESHGFNDMLERLQFMARVRRHDQAIVSNTKAARSEVVKQTVRLQRLQVRMRGLTAEVVRSRDEAAAVQGALLTRESEQLQQRAGSTAKLSRVQGQIASIHKQIARLARPVVTRNPVDLPVDAGGMAQAPAGAPAAVKQVIAAGNAIAGLPYLYGGGHGSFHANAYDCSGSVSYALAAAGLVSSPLDSTAFESWGEAGPGRWITVYANAGHAYMVVAGWRFDTSALSGGGTRWSRSMRSNGGFVARHPSGL